MWSKDWFQDMEICWNCKIFLQPFVYTLGREITIKLKQHLNK